MKSNYIKPKLNHIDLIHEVGIMTTSFSTISFGDQTAPYNPQVEDWVNEDLGRDQFEL